MKNSKKILIAFLVVIVMGGISAFVLLNGTSGLSSVTNPQFDDWKIYVWQPGRNEFTTCFNRQGEALVPWLITANGKLGTQPEGAVVPYQARVFDASDPKTLLIDWHWLPGNWKGLGKEPGNKFATMTYDLTYKNTHRLAKNGAINWDLRLRALKPDGKSFGPEKKFHLVINPYGSAKCGSDTGGITNQPPIVALTEPTTKTSFTEGENISLKAIATDPEGSLDKIVFYATKNGSSVQFPGVLTAPYLFEAIWRSAERGDYVVYAIASDTSGNITTSQKQPITIAPRSTEKPTVTIVNPNKGNLEFRPGSAIDIEATAQDNGRIIKVEFFRQFKSGADQTGQQIIKIGDASLNNSTGKWAYQWSTTNLPVGIYGLTAKATDDKGNVGDSNEVPIQLAFDASIGQAPIVKITKPANNAHLPVGSSTTVEATATDGDGTIKNVHFDVVSQTTGTIKATGDDNQSPYAFAWNKIEDDTYVVSVTATDNSDSTAKAVITVIGGTGSSKPIVNITKPQTSQEFALGTSIEIEADASDNLGIKKITFFRTAAQSGQGGTAGAKTKIGEVSQKNASGKWAVTYKATGIPALLYALTAEASDGTTTTISEKVFINILP